eukprot:6238-Heterococcus_DN1.PRE.3
MRRPSSVHLASDRCSREQGEAAVVYIIVDARCNTATACYSSVHTDRHSIGTAEQQCSAVGLQHNNELTAKQRY